MINTLATAALCLFVLFAAWGLLDWIEASRQQEREHLACEVRARKRMNAVLNMSDWSPR